MVGILLVLVVSCVIRWLYTMFALFLVSRVGMVSVPEWPVFLKQTALVSLAT